MNVRRDVSIVLAASSLLAAAMAGSTPAPAPAATTESAKGGRLIDSPRPGQVVRTDGIRIRVRGGRVLRARLNGVGVAREFRRGRNRVRTLHASISHGLRRGRNVLRVRVRRPGRPVRTATVRFRVRTSGPLTGAGRDRTVGLGDGWPLVGRVVNAKPRGRRQPVRWRVVDAPRRSKARGASTRRRLSSPAGRVARFRPDVPGGYTLRLSAGSGAQGASDLVQLEAVPNRLVRVDTMSGNPENPAIGIGRDDFPLSKAEGSGYMQLLVLERKTLEFVSNSRFGDADKLGAAIEPLGPDKLVIVSLQPDPAGGPNGPGDLDAALKQIGWPSLGDLRKAPGTVSAIGVPGWARGDADVKLVDSAARLDPQRGRMVGYLSPDQNEEYGFVPSRRVPFGYSTARDLPEDTPPQCSYEVCAGFLVRYQDAYTLETELLAYYPTGHPGEQHGSWVDVMAGQLRANWGYDSVVTVRALSTRDQDTGQYLPPIGSGVSRETMRRLADTVASVGGTRQTFNSVALTTPPQTCASWTFRPCMSYALVGWNRAGEGAGAEAAVGIDGTGDSPVLTGVLRAGRRSRMRPASVKARPLSADERSRAQLNNRNTDALTRLTLEPPTSGWPLDGDRGAQKALAYLGSQNSSLGSNPRFAYWNQAFAKPDAWIEVRDDIDRVKYLAGQGFSQDDFNAAQSQLHKELTYVYKVRYYLDELSTPFKDNQQVAWGDTQTIADGIYKAVEPSNDNVSGGLAELFEIVLELAEPFTGGATAEVAELLDFGMWAYGADNSGAPTYQDFSIAANQLGAQLEQQAQATEKAIARTGDVIVSDWAKLSVVGPVASCEPGPGCPEEYSFTTDDSAAASASINRGIQRLAYKRLFPLGYRVYQLLRDNPPGQPVIHRSKPPDPANYTCKPLLFPPFASPPANAYLSLLQVIDPAGADNAYDTFVLSRRTDNLNPPVYPPDAMLDHMFKEVPDTNDPKDDGLGMSKVDLVTNAKPNWFKGDQATEQQYCFWQS
jgi:hypothetical protein